MDWRDHIHSDDNVLHGKPVVKGTRPYLERRIGLPAQGWPEEMILENHPGVTKEDLQVVFTYVLDCLEDGLPKPAKHNLKL